jgi:hypothetical protein
MVFLGPFLTVMPKLWRCFLRMSDKEIIIHNLEYLADRIDDEDLLEGALGEFDEPLPLDFSYADDLRKAVMALKEFWFGETRLD